jgi:Protein of unknown function (DUF2806)
MMVEMAREQENLESIMRRSLEFVEEAPLDEKARELDDDWLFKFARFAETISDKTLQEIWAHILESAAIEGRPKLSAASLLQLSLVDHSAAVAFERFVRVSVSFQLYPAPSGYKADGEPNVDLMQLEELGLIKAQNSTGYQFSDFFVEMADHEIPLRQPGVASRSLPFMHSCFLFTQRGSEIANALFSGRSDAETYLSTSEEDLFLHRLIHDLALKHAFILIAPRTGPYYFIIHLQPGAAEPIASELWQKIISEPSLSERLRRLLAWATEKYSLTVHPRP